jgi:hypothetical protein
MAVRLPLRRFVAVTAAVALSTTGLTLATLEASAHPGHDGGGSADDARDAKQHDGIQGHLPASSKNVQLIGETSLKNVEPEKIADVGIHKGYAYLAAWGVTTCKYNGVHVVDIADPTAPREVAFVASKEGSYPGEGVQATTITTPAFSGDILVTNNERCKPTAGFGGLNIYDVTNPKRPTPLAVGIGDSSSTGIATASGEGKKGAHDIHSVFAWDAGDRAYAAIVDNDEAVDVDIMDITNPKAPFLTAEYDLASRFPSILQAAPANLTEVFLHDMVVKQVGDRFHMSANYWDAGYVVLDVTAGEEPDAGGPEQLRHDRPRAGGHPLRGRGTGGQRPPERVDQGPHAPDRHRRGLLALPQRRVPGRRRERHGLRRGRRGRWRLRRGARRPDAERQGRLRRLRLPDVEARAGSAGHGCRRGRHRRPAARTGRRPRRPRGGVLPGRQGRGSSRCGLRRGRAR